MLSILPLRLIGYRRPTVLTRSNRHSSTVSLLPRGYGAWVNDFFAEVRRLTVWCVCGPQSELEQARVDLEAAAREKAELQRKHDDSLRQISRDYESVCYCLTGPMALLVIVLLFCRSGCPTFY